MAPRPSVLAAAAALLASCASTAPEPDSPAVRTTSPHGVVWAETPEIAERARADLEVLAPRVQDLLPGVRDERPEIWVLASLDGGDGEVPDSVGGFTRFEGRRPVRIFLRDGSNARWAFAHELTHWYAGPDWDPLPGVLDDGLADWIAVRTAPELASEIRGVRYLNAAAWFGGMHFEIECDGADGRPERFDVWFHIDDEDDPAPNDDPRVLLGRDRWELNREIEYLPEAYYGIGFVAVQRLTARIGIEGLHAMCERAAREGEGVIPADWLLESAGIESRDGWIAAMDELLGPEELELVHALLPGLLARVLRDGIAPNYPGLTMDGFLERARPRIVFTDGTTRELLELPGLRRQLPR